MSVIIDGVVYVPYEPAPEKDDHLRMWSGSTYLMIDYKCDVLSESDHGVGFDKEAHSSGNYYNPDHLSIVAQWAKHDKFAALVRQYALSVHGGGIDFVKGVRQESIDFDMAGIPCTFWHPRKHCVIGDVYFATGAEAQSCLDWVLGRVEG